MFLIPIHRQAERRHRDAALRAPQFGITGQATHDDNAIEHTASSLFASADDHGAHDAVGNAEHAVQLGGEFSAAAERHQDIIAFRLVVDFVGQLALAPFLDFNSAGVLLGKSRELCDQSRSLFFALGGIDDVDNLILCRNLSHFQYTSFWSFGPRSSYVGARISVSILGQNYCITSSYITIKSRFFQAFFFKSFVFFSTNLRAIMI